MCEIVSMTHSVYVIKAYICFVCNYCSFINNSIVIINKIAYFYIIIIVVSGWPASRRESDGDGDLGTTLELDGQTGGSRPSV